MAHWPLIALVCTGISAAGLADYADQSRMAGVPLGEISALDYAGQFGLPNAAHRAELVPPAHISATEPRAYLPDAPEGWTRRHWSAGDNSWLHKQRQLGEREAQGEGTMLDQALERFMEHRDVYSQRRAFASGYIYERGDEIIFIGADLLEKGSDNGVIGRNLTKANRVLNRMNFREGYTLVHGVAYAETMHQSEAQRLFRSFQGRIGYGQEMRIRVRSHASIASVNALLEQIDHAGLNNLLDQPVAGVGTDAPRLAASQAARLAGYTFDIRDALHDLPPQDVNAMLAGGRPIDIARDGLANTASLDGKRVSEVQQ